MGGPGDGGMGSCLELFGDLLNAIPVGVEDEEFDSWLDTGGELLVIFYLGVDD